MKPPSPITGITGYSPHSAFIPGVLSEPAFTYAGSDLLRHNGGGRLCLRHGRFKSSDLLQTRARKSYERQLLTVLIPYIHHPPSTIHANYASAMKCLRLQPEDYTVGWVCALPIELAAAQEMLDQEHEDPPQDSSDPTLYTLGCIGDHNVVLACLPAGYIGTTSAATVATRMTSKFQSIRFGLMVGIGGGVPSARSDIRLGDVVVSQPYLQHGGVVQYDLGKTGACGRITRTGLLNAPPRVLLNAVSKLQANHYRGRCRISTHLSIFNRLPRFSRDIAGADVLFEAAYDHSGGATCEQCSRERVIRRTERGAQEGVTIHYGTIASGNQVMKDGVSRDRLSAELGGVLCFEMEAAGLMNEFPCLIIRGICDYADSHKNKTWQPYAAATAASCAKELLLLIAAAEVRIPRMLYGVPTEEEGQSDLNFLAVAWAGLK